MRIHPVRLLIVVALAAMLATSLVYRIRITGIWFKERGHGDNELGVFLRECAEQVPEDGVVHLITDSHQPGAKSIRHDTWEEARIATCLYPRAVRPCALKEVGSRPEPAWAIFVSEPFDRGQSWIKPIRDLR